MAGQRQASDGRLSATRTTMNRPAYRAMRLVPYLSVDGLPFALSPEQLHVRFGPPRRQARTSVGLNEHDYGDRVFRFQDSGRLEEVTQRAPVAVLRETVVPFAALAAFVRSHDGEAFERAGFLVSPRYGLAFVPASPDWVTALAAHCILTWRALK